MKDINLIECLKYIDPAYLTYTEWVNVGMALKHEGYTVSDWEEWSKADSRFHVGECEKKWETFAGSASPVTAGTIVQMAKENGWRAYNDESYALDWDSTIGGKSELKIIDKSWLEGTDIVIPENWEPSKQIITYINTLFEAAEIVGYVTECWQNNDGKYLPSKGSYTMTAGEIVEKLNKYGDEIGAALGDYKPEAGAWIRFNPLDATRQFDVHSPRGKGLFANLLYPLGQSIVHRHSLVDKVQKAFPVPRKQGAPLSFNR
jgi:hypothetical protein